MHSLIQACSSYCIRTKVLEVKKGWPQYGRQCTSGRESAVRTAGSVKTLVFREKPASVLLRPS